MHRRDFLKATAFASIARSTATPSPRIALNEFAYSDVTLTAGPLKRQYDFLRAHFLALDNDRLLKVYRQRAGLAAPGDHMGGWYDVDGFVPGHTLGQYISGLSRYYGATRDPACAEKVHALVAGYAATLGPNAYPYASEKAAITWPCYVLDKYEAGLLDAHNLTADPIAAPLLREVIRGAIPHIPDHTYDRGPDSPKQAPYDEPYILPENLFNSWQLTNDRRYLDMAKLYLLDHDYFDPLAENRNILPGKHAYSHTIALSSAAKAYEVLGDPKYLAAIRNAWDMIEKTQQYASGGWGPKEAFVPPGEGKLGESLSTTREHFETPCGCYAHTKLARYLLRFTGESRYGDGLERIVYNGLLASKDPGGDGEYFYYSDYRSGATKGYYKRKWPCCSGTLIQSVADYVLNIYFQSANTLYVNMYVPSEVRWRSGKVTQHTNYPDAGETELVLSLPRSERFDIALRIPSWLDKAARISINGKTAAVSDPGTFARVSREWKNGDRIQLTLPLSYRTEAIDNRNPDLVAVMQGPRMMVVTNGAESFPKDVANANLVPFYAVRNETYTTYFTLSGNSRKAAD